MNNYKAKKKKNQELINVISKHLSEQNLDLIWNCGTYLEFYSDKKIENKIF